MKNQSFGICQSSRTLNKNNQCIEPLGLTLAEAKPRAKGYTAKTSCVNMGASSIVRSSYCTARSS